LRAQRSNPDPATRHSGGASERANYDVQSHIRESMATQENWEKWIPGLRLAAHPGMTSF
jgi:hypothetical protein